MDWIIPESFLLRMKSNSHWSPRSRTGATDIAEIRATIALDHDRRIVSLSARCVDILGCGACEILRGERIESCFLNNVTIRPGRQHVEFERGDKKIIGLCVETMESSVDFGDDKGAYDKLYSTTVVVRRFLTSRTSFYFFVISVL